MRYLLLLVLLSTFYLGQAQTIGLPVEVLGEQGKVESRSIELTEAEALKADRLWLQINSLTYENKASIRINQGAWYDLNHESVEMQYQEKARGGMVHGGFNTVRLSIPVSGIQAGTNTIDFRFNRSDGISIGYRVVTFNLLDAAGQPIIPEDRFTEDDPATWEAPYTDATSIAEGKDLWENASLWSNYLEEDTTGQWYAYDLQASVPIKATCADCHVANGFDLEYFSYSNESIIERSKFHKLTEEEGKKITSYIRSLSGTVEGLGRYGRPWNPPYQPGPELKNKSIDKWAAGAGLDAILEKDKDMLDYMFPNGIDSLSIAEYFDSDKVEDHTLMPLAIQLPDWKHWLPIVHPMDAFSRDDFYHTTNVSIHPKKGMERLEAYLNEMPPAERNKGDLQNELRIFHRHFRHFMDQTQGAVRHWRTGGDAVRNGTYNERVAAIPDEIPVELAVTSLARLLAVKNFEYMNLFNLQDKAEWFTIEEDKSELTERGWQWIGMDYNVFEVPPHFTSCVKTVNCDEFVGQPRATGHYESTAWYQLQLVINGGNGNTGGNHPMDWQYQLDFIKRASASSGIPEPVRYYHSLNAMYQLRSNEKNKGPNSGNGFRARQQLPHWFYGINDNNSFSGFAPGEFPGLLDDIQPGFQRQTLNALLRQFLKEVNKPEMSLNNWRRKSPHGGANELEPASKSGGLINIEEKLGLYYYTDKMYYLIPRFAASGVDCEIINGLIDWSAEAWPNYDWHQFRQLTKSSVILAHNGSDECSVLPTQFEAKIGNAGDYPVFEWRVNGVLQAENSATFNYDLAKPTDRVSVKVISSQNCVNQKSAEAEYMLPPKDYSVLLSKNGGEWLEDSDVAVCDNDEISIKVEIPVEPLLWLDANQISEDQGLAEGGQVTSWDDRSGNNYNVSADQEALYPVYDSQGLNGLPAVMFGMDNNADGLRLFSTTDDDFMEEDWTMVMVGEERGIADWADVIGNKTESKYDDGWFMRFSNQGKSEISAGGEYYGGSHYALPFQFIAVMRKRGDVVSLHLNGRFERSLTVKEGERITTENEIFLGLADKGNANSNRFHHGPISEVMFFNTALSAQDQDVLEGYLAHKWKMDENLPLSHTYMASSPLNIEMHLPGNHTVAFNDQNPTHAYQVTSETQGVLRFYDQGKSCSTPDFEINAGYAIDPELEAISVKYTLDGRPVSGDDVVVVSEGQRLTLEPENTFGEYQWIPPAGTPLEINTNPTIEEVANDQNIGIWKLRMGFGDCYSSAVREVAFEVLYTNEGAYEVSVVIDGSGTSSLDGIISVNHGSSLNLELMPAEGHKLEGILFNDVQQELPTNNGEQVYYELTNVQADGQLQVVFAERQKYEITLTAASGGAFDQEPGIYEVFEGSSWSTIVMAGEGHRIDDVLVDSESQGARSKIELSDITKNHTVEVNFAKYSYAISARAGYFGSVSNEGETWYEYGSDVTYSFTPNEGYEVEEVWVDGQSQGAIDSYDFTDIQSYHSVEVSFKKEEVYHTITVIDPDHGSISPGTVDVKQGAFASFDISPDEGYVLDQVLINGRSVGKFDSYTFNNVHESHTLTAVFEAVIVAKEAVTIDRVYPNPAIDRFQIRTNREIAGVKVFTLDGQEMPIRHSDKFRNVALESLDSNAKILLVRVSFEDGHNEVHKLLIK